MSKNREPVKLSPRAVAPETAADLSAMRELANFSAQHAIDRSHRRIQGRAAPTKLLVALLALLATGLLLWIWTRLGDTVLLWVRPGHSDRHIPVGRAIPQAAKPAPPPHGPQTFAA